MVLSHESALVPIKGAGKIDEGGMAQGGREKESEWKVRAGVWAGPGAKEPDTLTG